MVFWPCLTPPTVLFNNIPVQRSTFQKHLGVYLDEKLNFNTHITEKIGKASKGIGVIKKLFKSLPRNALLTIYKSFVRPHLDYGEIVYDRPNNESFISKLEQVQYNATYQCRTDAFRFSFLPWTITEWNKIDIKI